MFLAENAFLGQDDKYHFKAKTLLNQKEKRTPELWRKNDFSV